MTKVLATVKEKKITQNNIDELMYTIPKENIEKFSSEEGQKELLEELVAQELFYLDAIENGLDKTEDFLEQLKITKEKFVKSYAISKYLMAVSVSDDEAKSFYDNNPDQFISQEKVKASHILVDSKDEMDKIYNDIKSNKISFEDAAKKFSKCPSKDNKGDLGFFQRGQMVKEFDEVAFQMNIGDIESNVKTTFGYHIILLTDKTGKGTMDYNTVHPQIKKYLLTQKQNKAYLDKVKTLKEQYPVSYDK